MADFFGFILYPVSAILWFWHTVFGALFGKDQGLSWVLAVFFLVFTLRVLLLKPALSQIRAGRKMQKFAPQMQKIREKYKNDRQKMTQEMQKMQSEQGVNPLGGCLPVLVQIPVFLSLFHVLRSFDPSKDSNFVFGKEGVDSFISADIFGAKLSNAITESAQRLEDFGTSRPEMIMVGIPLMVVASVATFFTVRMSMRRQSDAAMANPQSAMMGKFMMYLAPIGALVSGWFLPLAVLFYWLANNVWTLGQQHFLTNKVDREEQRQKERDLEAKKEAPRPKPGQKPDRSGESAAAVEGTAEEDSGSKTPENGTRSDETSGKQRGTSGAGEKNSASGAKGSAAGKSNGTPGGKPSGGSKSGTKSAGGSAGKKSSQQKGRSGKQSATQRSQKKRR